MNRVYMDYAGTTPVDDRVFEKMKPYFSEKFGNPTSLHSFGQEALDALDESRNIIAKAINAKSRNIFFTGSATESNNTVMKGVAFANKSKGKHIIISAIEHDCIINSATWLEKQGFEITRVLPDRDGMISSEKIKNAIRDDTILVSIIHANNEIGTINPIKEIGQICKDKNIYFHTDASQSFGKIPIDVEDMNIDLLTASSHKLYGPKGAALLYIRTGVKIEPLLHGGGQEFNKRSSTVNVAAIVGFSKATELCLAEIDTEMNRQTILRDKLIDGILTNVKNTYLNGHKTKRLANNVSIRFDFVEGESIIMMLDADGISGSSGSACSSPKLEPSHVLLACGLKHEEAHGTLRLSIGRFTTDEDVDYVIEKIPVLIEKLRSISPFK